jgi:hypothetical protein
LRLTRTVVSSTEFAVVAEPGFSEAASLALVSFLTGYTGLTRDAIRADRPPSPSIRVALVLRSWGAGARR